MSHSLQNHAARDRAIDVAKGLGMLLVIFGHTNYQEPGLTIIYSFHMPLFFAISGMLFGGDRYPTFGAFLRRKVKTLIVPFLLYAAVTLVFTGAVELLEHGFSEGYLPDMLKTAGRSLIARRSADFPYNAPLWFVPCLFLVECGYYLLSRIRSKPVRIAVIAAVFAGGWALVATRVLYRYTVWNFPAAMIALAFFAAGHLLFAPVCARLIERRWSRPKWALVALAGLTLTVLVALLNVGEAHVSLGSDVVNFAPLLLVSGVCGSVFVLAASRLFTARWVEYIGRNSFDFMAIHALVRTAVTFAMTAFLSVDFWQVNTDYRYTLPAFAVVLFGTWTIVAVKNAVLRKRKKT